MGTEQQLGNMGEFVGSSGEFRKLATSKWLGKTTVAIQAAIEQSFRTDVVLRPVMTQAEIKARFEICRRVFVILRRDCGWSIPRILDELPSALRIHLDGGSWNPKPAAESRSSW